jgi:hypothetical protein
VIAGPISYCVEDCALITAFEALAPVAQQGSYWFDPALEDLRSRVKAYYIAAQNTRCCYCNRHLGTDNHRVWDVEHVASRAKHACFMFNPTNLAASCPDCNTKKGDQEVLGNAKRKTYPKTSAGFLIVHPHFDKFEEHIHKIDMVYLAKTEKGKRTIYVCDLLRFAQKFIAWDNSAIDTTFEQEVDTVFGGGSMASQAAIDAILAKLPTK